jgi:hypothetical protein
MASRGSFQKRQKEAARKEKRQQKLDRRQGRAPIGQSLHHRSSSDDQEEKSTDDVNGLPEDASTAPADTKPPDHDNPSHAMAEAE